MPCLIIVGHPSSGKTTLAKLLKERALLHSAIDEVVLLNEESTCGCVESDASGSRMGQASGEENSNKIITTKEELYVTSTAEKQTRGALKAAFDRSVKKAGANDKNSRRLVILDSMNYIKGFRYELHCISKAAGEKHGVLWVLNRLSLVRQWNKNYSSELLKELISRFEPPDDRNRWDKPLFTVDVAAAANLSSPSNKDNKDAVKKLSSKNEVMENSVYNMHALGEAFGMSSASEQSDDPVGSPAVVANANRPKKSAFSRTTKKSAFQRKKKSSTQSEDEKKTTPSSYNNGNKIIFDTSIMMSREHDSTSEKSNRDQNFKSKPTTAFQETSESEETPDTKSIEEQLDEILDTFLLQTQNLKEGMSTRQYA